VPSRSKTIDCTRLKSESIVACPLDTLSRYA
jgi:hypothetical protein